MLFPSLLLYLQLYRICLQLTLSSTLLSSFLTISSTKNEIEKRKEARNREKSERGPRTAGHLYRYVEKEKDGVVGKVIERVFNEQERAEQQERERVHKEKEEERQARIALQAQSQPVSSPKAIQQRAVPRDVSPVVAPQGTSAPDPHTSSFSLPSFFILLVYHFSLLSSPILGGLAVSPVMICIKRNYFSPEGDYILFFSPLIFMFFSNFSAVELFIFIFIF
jgi:hypothetical protein